MPSFEYIVPVVYSGETDNTKICTRDFVFKDCSFTELHPEACSAWGQTKCPGDSLYCQPYKKGDVIYTQFIYNPNTMEEFQVSIVDMKTGTVHEVTLTEQSGPDDEKNYYYNFNIDTNQILFNTTTCFQIMIEYLENGEEKTVYSEPYCVVRCEEKTVVVEGTYTQTDCNGHYYGLINGVASIYKSIFRVPGEVVKTGFEFEKVRNVTPKKNYATKSRTNSRYRFYVPKLPPYVIEQLAQCFGGQYLYLDGINYEEPTRMNKEFEEGQSWIPVLEVSKPCEQIDFTCD